MKKPKDPEYLLIRADLVEFLRGSAQLEGLWFNDGRQRYWWRKYLPVAAVKDCEHNWHHIGYQEQCSQCRAIRAYTEK